MKTRIVLIFILLVPAFAAFSQHPKLTVYYPNWAARCIDANGLGLPPWNIDFRGIDYVVHSTSSSTVNRTDPYWTPAQGGKDSIDFQWGVYSCETKNYQDSLIHHVHDAGGKVVIAINAITASDGFDYVAPDSARTEVFAASAVAYCLRKGYDGLEFDLEGNTVATDYHVNRFINIVRRHLNTMPARGILLTSAGRDEWNRYYPTTDSAVDMHNLQCYSYAYIWSPELQSNMSWFQTPIHSPAAFTGTQQQTLEENVLDPTKSVVDKWVEAGHLRSKIGIGFGNYGMIIRGTQTWGTAIGYTDFTNDIQLQDVKSMLNHGGTRHWDGSAHSPYISGTASGSPYWWAPNGKQFYITFDDSSSIGDKIQWADSIGTGGVMIYAFEREIIVGADSTGTRGFAQRCPTIARAVQVLQSLRGAPSVPAVPGHK